MFSLDRQLLSHDLQIPAQCADLWESCNNSGSSEERRGAANGRRDYYGFNRRTAAIAGQCSGDSADGYWLQSWAIDGFPVTDLISDSLLSIAPAAEAKISGSPPCCNTAGRWRVEPELFKRYVRAMLLGFSHQGSAYTGIGYTG